MVDWSKLETVKTEADIEAENAKTSAIKYLNDTDWYIIRLMETQEAVPAEISTKRANARKQIKESMV